MLPCPKDQVYTNPHGVRCTLQDNQANVFGRDTKTGAAPQIFDNVGVQYGLHAFNDGKISADHSWNLTSGSAGSMPMAISLRPVPPATGGRSRSHTRQDA